MFDDITVQEFRLSFDSLTPEQIEIINNISDRYLVQNNKILRVYLRDFIQSKSEQNPELQQEFIKKINDLGNLNLFNLNKIFISQFIQYYQRNKKDTNIDELREFLSSIRKQKNIIREEKKEEQEELIQELNACQSLIAEKDEQLRLQAEQIQEYENEIASLNAVIKHLQNNS